MTRINFEFKKLAPSIHVIVLQNGVSVVEKPT